MHSAVISEKFLCHFFFVSMWAKWHWGLIVSLNVNCCWHRSLFSYTIPNVNICLQSCESFKLPSCYIIVFKPLANVRSRGAMEVVTEDCFFFIPIDVG